MTDREMLELAAKAYGFGDPEGNFIWTESEYPRGSKTNGALWNYIGWCDTAQLWNPLTDDGDALRLAVKLHMQVSVTTESCRAETLPCLGVRVNDSDENLATRRAVVMAAAAVGREMK